MPKTASVTLGEMVEMFKEAEDRGQDTRWRKNAVVMARLAVPGELVVTVIDGVEETRRTAGSDDVVVKGPKGEEYATEGAKFRSRYETPDGMGPDWRKAVATGSCWAYEHAGAPYSFVAPWGEKMIVESGDRVAMPDKSNPKDLYRIEKGAFELTYVPF